ncbi:NADH-quinone oxidoreductase subunit M [Nocardioides marmoriginsengisoli]|uniref:NADH-quinone oxidoreductase subunit M n=1 Tax=Nocardioides marmoriginsengisoli TaxID=661483 RepID=A0A3N0CG80_9ACTN|nr:NADH-quinone oxidoreductase subunit M [Nocardioides marmoriginsengisoli]RNL62309.1 NADH-quinone oxidoreductase subunit M [Nocardioides marmoriginsengisoli]
MNDFPWLSVMLFLPIVGALVLVALPARVGSALPKQLALGTSLVTLVVGIVMAIRYDSDSSAQFQFTEQAEWIKSFGAHYALGVDGVGLTLVILTAILAPVVILASWNDGDNGRWSAKAFFAWMLALEGLAIGVFAATDVFLFYVFFEATLIPVYFLIGGYGGANRARAAVKFLLYSLAGGLIMLASVIGLYVESAKSDGGATYLVTELAKLDFGTDVGRWLFLGFFVAFAIKAPMFPVHTWLPDTTENATPGTSVLLVSVLDKIGTFGMLRFCLELFPEASRWATPAIVVFAVISIIYGAFMAIGSDNIPRLIAYTSVSHFGFIVLGIFVMNSQGLSGANLYMFNHGLSTAALFLVTGFLISRRGSALVSDYGGVEKVAPVLAGIFLVAGLSSLSLPGLSPFISEFLVIVGTFSYSHVAGAFAVTGIVLAAIYILFLYQRTMTGPTRDEVKDMKDLGTREIAALAPVLLLIVILGFFPKPLLSVINPAVDHTMERVQKHDPAPDVDPSSLQEGAHE